jgi:hypothetical protein
MFYEPESDFFYDPKSTLYYGNRQKKYFRYSLGRRPPFEEVVGGASSQSESAVKWSDTQQEVASKEQEAPKKMIEVNIKTTVLNKKKRPKKNVANTIQEPSLTKNHAQRQKVAMIVEKWKISLNEKDDDIKEQSKKTPSSPREPVVAILKEPSPQADNRKKTSSTRREPVLSTRKEQQSPQQAPDKRRKSNLPSLKRDPIVVRTHQASQDKKPKNSPPVVTQKTVKGMPVCILCQRKFRSIEQLRCHESLSQLHKDNMKKFELAKKEDTKNSPPTPTRRSSSGHHQETRPGPSTRNQYQDRSKKRKILFEAGMAGMVLPSTKKQLLRQVISSGIDVAGELKKVQERLEQQADAARAQAAILQPAVPDYSSWLGGLGRRAQNTEMTDSIRKEWDIIEALGSAPGPDSYKQKPPQGGSGLGFNT